MNIFRNSKKSQNDKEFQRQKETLKQFKKTCRPQTIKVNNKKWTYYECFLSDKVATSGSSLHVKRKSHPPLIMLHDLSGSAIDFYNQFAMIFDEGKDYYFVSVEIPSHCTSIDEFVIEFDHFLNVLLYPYGIAPLSSLLNGTSPSRQFMYSTGTLSKSCDESLPTTNKAVVHLLGAGLGAFLAQCYAEAHSEKLASLLLVNGFMNSALFSEYSPLNDFYILAPKFLLSTKIINLFDHLKDKEFMNNDEILYSIEYMLDYVSEESSRGQLASRLSLISDEKRVNIKKITKKLVDMPGSPTKFTIIDCMDDENLIYPHSLRTELHKNYPYSDSNIRLCLMKNGGSFPYISRVDEFNIYLTVHLRSIFGLGNSPSTSIDDMDDSFDNIQTSHLHSDLSSDSITPYTPYVTPERTHGRRNDNILDSSKSTIVTVMYQNISFTPHTPPDIAEDNQDRVISNVVADGYFEEECECESEKDDLQAPYRRQRASSGQFETHLEEDEEDVFNNPKDMLF